MPAAETIAIGIETSCDETAVAVVRLNRDASGDILSNIIRSQWEQHRPFGGVVPEIAARAHMECIAEIAAEAISRSGIDPGRLDCVAATAGPGLIGGLLVGLTFAKGFALALGKPLVAVNHLEAHALTAGLTNGIAPPYLLLLVSGGHTQTVLVRGVGDYQRIGSTIDDALGEAFDKTAKILGLGFPGGPAVEAAAKPGDPRRFDFPRPMKGRPEPHFSFAGLKTAVRREAQRQAPLSSATVADLTASFEAAVCDSVTDRCRLAYEVAAAQASEMSSSDAPLPLVVAGGVAANTRLRQALQEFVGRMGTIVVFPPLALCTDNGAMIAWTGAQHLIRGQTSAHDVPARARWPLDDTAAPIIGKGRNGPKA
ncbi:MAG: tRNA (adenosine(37)-N6)-threonylcarbamoyltransferase complex transferase subunit TsaD [Alphaproteobacteria bacterium]|nr:tRNA (adenosine(37)-N6)-threonylcarbamoyltransferase complex transferase subunit TsaD [Alphaproteobacteria bacterium]